MSNTPCGKCGCDLIEAEEEGKPSEYEDPFGVICHKCWHDMNPTTPCIDCNPEQFEGGAAGPIFELNLQSVDPDEEDYND